MFGFMPLRFRAEPDVNSVDGFTRALVTAAGGELSDEAARALAEQPDRSVQSGLTSESDPPPEPDPVAPEEEPEEEAEEEGGVAPQATPSDFEAGYLKALGENSERLGEERARREALEARISQLEAGSQSPEEQEEEFYIPDEQGWDRLGDLMDNMGGAGMMAQIAQTNPAAFDAALALWKAGGDIDLASAHLYEANFNRLLATEGSAQPVAPELPPEVAEVVQERRMNAIFADKAAALGERAPLLAPHVGPALEAAPELVKQSIGQAFASDDPKQHQAAFDTVVALAEQRAGSGTPTPPVQQQRQAVSRQVKQAAGLGTGSQRASVRSGQAGNELPKSKAEFEQLKREDPARARSVASQLLSRSFAETETTSVAEGLKQGRGQQ